jgi:RNA polymerase sigma-70 factor (ECF subfamily)
MKTTENIWTEYSEKLSAFLRTRVDNDVAEDILQDVFVKIHSKIDTLKENTKLESWLYQITRNAVIDYYRSKRPTVELPEWIEQEQVNEDEIIRKELSSCLTPMIEQLPEKYRSAVKLSEIESKTQREVAEIEKITLAGAKSRVQRGRSILMGMLHECCRFELNGKNQLVDYKRKDPEDGSC